METIKQTAFSEGIPCPSFYKCGDLYFFSAMMFYRQFYEYRTINLDEKLNDATKVAPHAVPRAGPCEKKFFFAVTRLRGRKYAIKKFSLIKEKKSIEYGTASYVF